MLRMLISALTVSGLLFLNGCASDMETINRGAGRAGETGGGVMRLPNSFTEGAAKGTAGQPSPNPYSR